MQKFNATYRKKVGSKKTEDEKHLNIQIGIGYMTESGPIDVVINAIPINWDGKLRLWPHTPKVDEDDG